ncbi:WD40 repeat-like protein [Suhomyces tanzawaensis NRRL Y-17324]|uniref:WD40 repeat-like protein n=1 Tax=Suhomyces tanzawaensis NRRL Y-17324 TaxID=984487 RepID=A0A1E4SD03_9ASCO|nr:WD40 repeat-like protein [Suhomyces tanzawaensis NRRL Y-17324]ODV77346.1 WD40 repeat-like protein [Suhomyces tanzawaensis NRRL Y-17324]
MGKQYISTVSAAQAHSLDITDLTIVNKFTITVSSDGYANFWDNKQDEVHDPKQFVHKELINELGVHHVASYENNLPSSSIRIVFLAFASFDGSVVFKYYINDDISTLKSFEPVKPVTNSWAPVFHKDPESKQDYFICTKADGTTTVYSFTVAAHEDDVSVDITLEKFGDLDANASSFPTSIAVSETIDKKVAIGYANGDVLLYDLLSLKTVYTFHSTDLQISHKSKTSRSIPRVLRFSPGGTILAIARDNQSSGSITLYDVQFGENIGSLTTPSHSAKSTIGGFAHEGWIMGLSFDEEGKNLASCGFDKCVRVWNLDTRERESTITVSISDLEDTEHDEFDKTVLSGVEFIKKKVRGGAGGDTNEGLCVISFDRGIRWYREAGGI